MKIQLLKTLTLLTFAIAFVGCGKDNKTNTNAVNGGVILGSSNVAAGNTPNNVQSLYSQLNSAMPCKTGQRLSTIAQFSIQGGTTNQNYSQNSLRGQFNPGTIGGTVGQLYMGVSTFNDIMIIAEMSNGNQVVGHNVYMAMCTAQNLIFEGRTLSNFQAANGIVLDKNTNCPYGVIDAANNTYLQADAYQSQYGQVYPAAVWTTFYNVNCN